MSLNDFNYNTDAFKMQKEASNHNGNEETQTTKKWQRNEFFAASAVEITKKDASKSFAIRREFDPIKVSLKWSKKWISIRVGQLDFH